MTLRTLLLAALLTAAAAPSPAAEIDSKDFSNADLYQLAKVRTVELVMTPAEWKAMTPHYSNERGRGLLGPEGGHNGFLAAKGLTFGWGHSTFTIDGKTFNDVGIRYKGQGTYSLGGLRNKISMKIELSKYVKGQKLASVSTLNLASNVTDAGWMNEELGYRLFRDAGVNAPRATYAKVYVTVTGQAPKRYLGLFSIIEEVDQHFLEDRYGTTAGAIFKPVAPSLFTYLSDDWKDYNQTYDPKTDLTPAQKARVIDFAKIVTSATAQDFAAKLPAYVDLDNLARFVAVTTYMSDLDGFLNMGQNYYMYLDPKTNKFSFTAWDQDRGFGQMARASNAQTENFSVMHPWSTQNHFLERVFAVPAFRDIYVAKMREFSTTIFEPARLFKQVDELAPVLRPALTEESPNALRQFDQVTANPPEKGMPYGETLKSFVKARTPKVIDQLDGKSNGDRVDVSITAAGTAQVTFPK